MFLNYKKFPCEPSNNISIGSSVSGDVVEPVILDGSEHVPQPFEHLDARSFSLRSVIETGGSLKPAPRLRKSNLEERDRVDNFFNSNNDKLS